MLAATLQKHFSLSDGDWLIYSERIENGIRELTLACERKGSGVSLLGFSVSWKKITLYPRTLSGWNYGTQMTPLTDEERKRVLQTITIMLINEGYLIREDWNHP